MTAPQATPQTAAGDQAPRYLGSPTSPQALDRAIAALSDLLAARAARLRRAVAKGDVPPLEIEAAQRRLADHRAALDLLVMMRAAGQIVRATWDGTTPAGLPTEIAVTRAGADGTAAGGSPVMTLDHTAIRARMRDRMAQLALSQRALARAAGIDQGALSRGLAGKSDFVLDTLAALAPSLKIDLAELLGLPGVGLPEGGSGAADAPGELRLPLDAIAPDRRQPRRTFDAAAIEDLARSIAVHGLLQPLLVAPIPPEDRRQGSETPPPTHLPTHLLIAGERRWRALRRVAYHYDLFPRGLAGVPGLEDERVPCRLLPLAATRSPQDQLAAQLVENLQRADLTPADLARGYQRLREAGWDTREVAEAVGRSMRHVQDYLALVERLAPAVLEALDDGSLRYAQARVLTQATRQTQHALLGRIRRGDLTTERQIHDAVQAAGRQAREATATAAQTDLEDLTGGRPAPAAPPDPAGPDSAPGESGEAPGSAIHTLATWPPETLPEPVLETPAPRGAPADGTPRWPHPFDLQAALECLEAWADPEAGDFSAACWPLHRSDARALVDALRPLLARREAAA